MSSDIRNRTLGLSFADLEAPANIGYDNDAETAAPATCPKNFLRVIRPIGAGNFNTNSKL
jgi:hypothetical protein